MITSKDRVIKVSFYYDPTDDIFDAEDMRMALYDFFGITRLYLLKTKDTTIEKENENR